MTHKTFPRLNTVRQVITYNGAILKLNTAGISLSIPDASIGKNLKQSIYLSVMNEDKIHSVIPDICTHISPTIHCGPYDINLNKPAILKIPHCAENLENWRISLYYSNAHIQDPEPMWRKVVTLGEETINTPTYVQIDDKFVCIMTEFLGRFALIGETITSGQNEIIPAVKRLKLFIFGPSIQPIADCNIRVYVIEDLPSSKEYCCNLESKLGGIFLGQSSSLFYHDNGQDLHLTIKCTGGWKPKHGTESQKIPFSHVWNNGQALHCAFAIEHNDKDESLPISASSSALKVEVCARQRSGGDVIVTHVASFLPIEIAGHSNIDEYSDGSIRSVTVSDKGVNTCVQTDDTQIFKLTRQMKRDLCNCLDPPTNRGNDWRMLAQRLHCDRYIAYFATKPSPTEHILDLWECRNREPCAIADLSMILRNMSRLDAVEILEKSKSPAWL